MTLVKIMNLLIVLQSLSPALQFFFHSCSLEQYLNNVSISLLRYFQSPPQTIQRLSKFIHLLLHQTQLSIYLIKHLFFLRHLTLPLIYRIKIVFLSHSEHPTTWINISNVSQQQRTVHLLKLTVILYCLSVGSHTQFLTTHLGITATQIIIQLTQRLLINGRTISKYLLIYINRLRVVLRSIVTISQKSQYLAVLLLEWLLSILSRKLLTQLLQNLYRLSKRTISVQLYTQLFRTVR